jgi:glycine C-acetyltransferase
MKMQYGGFGKQPIKANEAKSFQIVTDGVFSRWSCSTLIKYVIWLISMMPWLLVDECHAAGFIGATGKGTPG